MIKTSPEKAHILEISTGALTGKRILLLAVMMVAGWMPVLLFCSKIEEAAGMFRLAALPQPYFIPDHAGLLYFWTPLVAMSACFLLLSPGLMLSIALGASEKVGLWILSAVAISIPLLSAVVAITQHAIDTPITGTAFALLVIGCWLISFALIIHCWKSGKKLAWPLSDSISRFTLVTIVIVSYALLVGLLPKFLWDNFHGDGVHAYETARLLLFQPLPFWNPAAGPIANYPGVTSMLFAFPASWFIRLFGEFEVSARMPMLIYALGLFGGIIAISEEGQNKMLRKIELILIWLGLTIFVVVVVFNVTYNPYSADISLPPARETLLIVCYLGFILSFLRRQHGWMILFMMLTFFSLPTGLFLMGLWIGAVLLIVRPVPWFQLGIAMLGFLSCILLQTVMPYFLSAIDFPQPGREFNSKGIEERIGFYEGDFRRLLFVFLPCGILPAFAVAAWRRQDAIGRSLSIVTLASFLFFYFQRNTALNHFMPVMIPPLIIYWRMHLAKPWPRRTLFLISTAGAAVLALWISFPQNYHPHTAARTIGTAILDRIEGYETFDPAAFRRPAILSHLFPLPWDRAVPNRAYGGSPQVWYFYSRQKKDFEPQINYVIQETADPHPEGMTLIAQQEDWSLYVVDRSVWRQHRALRPPTPPGSKVYAIPRRTLFKRETQKRKP